MPYYQHPITLWDHFDIAMVRDRPDFIDTEPEPNGLYVQLGTGFKEIIARPQLPPQCRWINLDFPAWDANKDELPFMDDAVNGVVCYHSMDHFEDAVRVLAEVQRVLVQGGWFVNVVPHYSSQLAAECIAHKNRFAIDTWRNIFSERQYKHVADGGQDIKWQLRVGFNMVMALTERNTVLVTQLIKE